MSDPVEPVTVDEVVVSPAAAPDAPAGTRVYRPQISILLHKVVNRTATVAEGVNVADRIKATEGGSIELARYLGDGSTVTVRRTCRGQDTGMFSITFPDQMNASQMDSVYGLVEPMDAVEIRMARRIAGGEAAKLPIVLRGFVSEVTRSEAMAPNGPQRTITITGHDYSKILQIMRVIYLPTMIVGQDLLTPFNLFLNYNIDAKSYLTAAEFVQEVVDKSVRPYLERIRARTSPDDAVIPLLAPGTEVSPVQLLNVEAYSPAATSNVSPFGTQAWPGGTIYDLLAHFGDVGAWQELFIEDREDGPYLIYRPTPFKDASGAYIQDGAEAKSIGVGASDLLAITATRSDFDVANYFWVEAPSYQLVGSPLLQLDQNLKPDPAVTDYQNNDPSMYGIRLLQVASQQGGRYDGQAEVELDSGEVDALNLNNDKRRILIENNKDNVVLEHGQMTIKGNEGIRPGMYVTLDRGGFLADYYGHTVTHTFQVGGAFTTQVEYDRGTGFIERVQRAGGASSAYLAELTMGGVYGQ